VLELEPIIISWDVKLETFENRKVNSNQNIVFILISKGGFGDHKRGITKYIYIYFYLLIMSCMHNKHITEQNGIKYDKRSSSTDDMAIYPQGNIHKSTETLPINFCSSCNTVLNDITA
jgi:hypothetical protein